jgi:hypothetical protein
MGGRDGEVAAEWRIEMKSIGSLQRRLRRGTNQAGHATERADPRQEDCRDDVNKYCQYLFTLVVESIDNASFDNNFATVQCSVVLYTS